MPLNIVSMQILAVHVAVNVTLCFAEVVSIVQTEYDLHTSAANPMHSSHKVIILVQNRQILQL
jgi:hypothetical protein